MADHRISQIELDEATILWRNSDIEQERKVAIFDLIEDNSFKPCRSAAAGMEGPWRLKLSVQDGRLAMEIGDSQGREVEQLILGLARFRRPIREYFAICDSYYQAIPKASARPRAPGSAARTTRHARRRTARATPKPSKSRAGRSARSLEATALPRERRSGECPFRPDRLHGPVAGDPHFPFRADRGRREAFEGNLYGFHKSSVGGGASCRVIHRRLG